jgi:hypothetical protein
VVRQAGKQVGRLAGWQAGRLAGILPNLADSLPNFLFEVGVYVNAWGYGIAPSYM